jgi:PDZ domain-containing protein
MTKLRRHAGLITALCLLLVFAACVAANTINSPYVAVAPAGAYDASTALTGPDLNPDLASQHYYVTTVTTTPLRWWGYLWAKASSTATLQANPLKYPVSQFDAVEAGQLLMISAQRSALYISARQITKSSPLTPSGAQVVLVGASSPAAKSGMRQGQVITQVNGQRVNDADALTAALALVPKGAPLRLTMLTPTSTIYITSYAGPRSLGIEVTTYFSGQTPYQFTMPGVGGPSGGLQLTLAATAAISKGNLSGPYKVSGTGTISPSGQVGPIEGIKEKIASAHSVHATLFFVPPADFATAHAAAYSGLKVVQVRSYTQALNWLCTHGATSSACNTLEP